METTAGGDDVTQVEFELLHKSYKIGDFTKACSDGTVGYCEHEACSLEHERPFFGTLYGIMTLDRRGTVRVVLPCVKFF